MITHDIGNKFWGIDIVKGKLTSKITTVHESGHPYRYCNNAKVRRILPGKVLLTGTWCYRTNSIDEHLMEALRGKRLEMEKGLLAEYQ